jgi:dipeptidyl aminopeptidase/acylaminoacyl peptidase
MSAIFAALLASTIIPTAELPPPAADPCRSFDSRAGHSSVERLITAADLVELGDIGRSDPYPSESPFAISPDGKHVAFLLRRANAQENAYCQRLLVAPMRRNGVAVESDRGGAFIRRDFELRKFISVMTGLAKVIIPRWSPGGQEIAFFKMVGTSQQVWLADPTGSKPAYQVTSLPDNVDEFAWSEDGRTLVVASRPGIRQQAEAIAGESRHGFLFDERFAPQVADRPIPIEPLTTVYHAVDIKTGIARQATAAETASMTPKSPADIPEEARDFSASPDGKSAAWLHPLSPGQLLGASGVTIRTSNGGQRTCNEPCRGVRRLMWSADGNRLYGLQKFSWLAGKTSLLRWTVGDAAPTRVMVTENELIGCMMAGKEMVCARENVLTPRQLVAINPDTGTERVIFEPNPDFRKIRLGQVQRFTFRNAFGIESHADLVLPPDHKPGDKHPLVVVQYASFGFLRGGTGDEFPVQLLAAKGIAVLSFSRPDAVPAAMAAKTELEFMRESARDWADRRSVQSALEIAIERALATGTIDNENMGISGFSDGGATVQWSLINSSLFKAAAMGSCCEGFDSFTLAAGPTFTQQGRDIGFKFFEPGVEERWLPLSLTLNVDRIDAPILIQNTDSEYEGGLDVVETFRNRGKAIEMFVFEGEPHIKYQPAHRLAIYERSTEWFQFWLMGMMNCTPAKAGQYARWKAMRNAPAVDRLRCEAGTSTTP